LKSVAVIIPAYNEATFIGRTIVSIKAQDYPSDKVKIVVVDNGSTDGTADIAKKAGANVINFPKGKVGAVRNFGVENSQNDIVAFIDADCIAGPRWLSEAVHLLEDPSIGAVGGIYLLSESPTWVEKAFVGFPDAKDMEADSLPGGSMIMRRDTFLTIGRFSETLSAAEDDEISKRIQSYGYRILTRRACAVIHLGYPKTLYGMFKKQLWHGSNQLEASSGILDKLLLITHCFALCFWMIILATLGMLISQGLQPWLGIILVSCAGMLIVSFSAAYGKAVRTHGGTVQAVPLMLVYVAYFLGRTFVLLTNYTHLIRNRFINS
jgi:cellulose synthase/poly-beta-1,6-N-acetylglucosamine synthase-like glycosyltransferase